MSQDLFTFLLLLLMRGQSLGDFIDPAKLPKGLLVFDNGGFVYINPDLFPQVLAQDIDPAKVAVLAAAQKPYNQSILTETSGPPAWKQLPTWYGVSENDRIVPPDAQHAFANQINATVLTCVHARVLTVITSK
jgi:hypothetical protein